MGAYLRTINGQVHKIIWLAGPERDMIFYLRTYVYVSQRAESKAATVRVTVCREQGSHCRDERLAWVASRWQGTSCSRSFISKVLGANYKRSNNFHPVADKFTMFTDRK